MTERARDPIGNLLLNGPVLARSAYPELRLQDRPSGHNARRELGVTAGTICTPLCYMRAALWTIAPQGWLLILW